MTTESFHPLSRRTLMALATATGAFATLPTFSAHAAPQRPEE